MPATVGRQQLFGRTAETAGLALWTGQLAQGVSRGSVTADIAESPEAKAYRAPATAHIHVPNAAGTLAHELYETGLGREVEPTGLQAFKAAYASVSPAQLAAALVDSAEFIAIHLGQDNATYVDSLYQAGLGRHAEAPGLVSWTRQLDSGQLSRADVLLGVATSAESGLHWTHGLSV